MRAGLVALALLCAGDALAGGSVDGRGRVSVYGGYRWVPNGYFEARAREVGMPVLQPSPGGVQAAASFAYGVHANIEVAIDALVAWERFEVQGLDPFDAWVYGGVVGPRFTTLDLLVDGFCPYAGVQYGPLLSSLRSGPAAREKLMGAFSVNGGFDWRLTTTLALSLDVRWVLARHFIDPIGGANVGGLWASVGVTFFFAAERERDLAVPGF